jgi:hypothetical protein
VRRAGVGSAATAPRPIAAPRHEVRGEWRGKEGAPWLCWRWMEPQRGLGLGEEKGWLAVSTSRRGGRELAGGSGSAGERGAWRRRREEEGGGVRVWRGGISWVYIMPDVGRWGNGCWWADWGCVGGSAGALCWWAGCRSLPRANVSLALGKEPSSPKVWLSAPKIFLKKLLK